MQTQIKKIKSQHDRVGTVIHLELCKRFHFESVNKLEQYKTENVLENNKF